MAAAEVGQLALQRVDSALHQRLLLVEKIQPFVELLLALLQGEVEIGRAQRSESCANLTGALPHQAHYQHPLR